MFNEAAYQGTSYALTNITVTMSAGRVTRDLNAGLFPSVLASKSSVREAAGQGLRFFMETDYLDDPGRPGAVMGVKTIPKRTAMLLEEGLVSPEDMWTIHDANPREVYGVDMDL